MDTEGGWNTYLERRVRAWALRIKTNQAAHESRAVWHLNVHRAVTWVGGVAGVVSTFLATVAIAGVDEETLRFMTMVTAALVTVGDFTLGLWGLETSAKEHRDAADAYYRLYMEVDAELGLRRAGRREFRPFADYVTARFDETRRSAPPLNLPMDATDLPAMEAAAIATAPAAAQPEVVRDAARLAAINYQLDRLQSV